MASLNHPTYNHKLFSNRQAELEAVARAAGEVHAGEPGAARLINFAAEQGLGKTWFFLHLQRETLKNLPHARAFLACFRSPGLPAQKDEWFWDGKEHDAAVRGLMRFLAARLEIAHPEALDLRSLSYEIVEQVEREWRHHTLIFALDAVYDLPDETLSELERYLLAPLATLPNVLLLMSGRSRPYLWESAYLRDGPREERLRNFNEAELQAQLARIDARITAGQVEEIYACANGHPLTSVLLLETENRRESLDMAIKGILDTAAAGDLRAWFEALAPLEGFRENEVAPMLAAYSAGQPGPGALVSATQVREVTQGALLESGLVRFENGRYRLDDGLRGLVNRYLQTEKPGAWARLHRQARDLYQTWAEGNSAQSDYFRQQAHLHEQALQSARQK